MVRQRTCLEKRSPIDGTFLARIAQATQEDYERAVAGAQRAFLTWRTTPAPKRGEVVRRLGERLRELKAPLGRLVSLEAGKILAEGEGEVQEMIDICDFANGLSRQLYGLTIASERANHRMLEQWHPLGLVGIISAFNFPVAVWSWNSALAVVCGNATLWKPSEKTPLTAIACIKIAEQVCRESGIDPALWSLAVGGSAIGRLLAEDHACPTRLCDRFDAHGTNSFGNRCAPAWSYAFGTRRQQRHDCHPIRGSAPCLESSVVRRRRNRRPALYDDSPTDRSRIRQRALGGIFATAYSQVRIGNPLDPDTLMGPLIDAEAVHAMGATLEEIEVLGGRILYGGERARRLGIPRRSLRHSLSRGSKE